MAAPGMSLRDIISSVIFYAGLVGFSALLIRVGTTYGWEKVDEQFRLMEPRLMRGQYAWINKRARHPDKLLYGDIIVYDRPLWKRGTFKYEFARVIGKPGDVVEVRERHLYRAERLHDRLEPKALITEHYVQTYRSPREFSEFIVPRNTVFVLYDDRGERVPLRDLIVPVRAIHGKVMN